MNKSYSIDLDLYSKIVKNTSIWYVCNDDKTMSLHINLFIDGVSFIPSDTDEIEIMFRTHTGISYPRRATVSDNSILYEIKATDIHESGKISADITIINGDGGRLTWQRFTFMVRNDLSDGKPQPDYITPWIDDILGKLAEIRTIVDNNDIPNGGISGQVLGKLSNDDYNIGWIDITSDDIISGSKGDPGLSAYELAVMHNEFIGTLDEWLISLHGESGIDGYNGWSPILALVENGERRIQQVVDWMGGSDIKPATGLYVGANGFVTEISQAVDIRGSVGAIGGQGIKGVDGITPHIDPTTRRWMIGAIDTGVTAIGITPHIDSQTKHWFINTEDTGVIALGKDGNKGKSAYEIAVDNGFIGTEQEWLISLKGNSGDTPVKGDDYFTQEEQETWLGFLMQYIDVQLGVITNGSY